MYDDLKLRRRALLVLAGACVAVFFTGFELKRQLITVGPVGFTDTELAAGFFFLTSVVWAWTDRARYFTWRKLDLAVLLFTLSNYLSVSVAVDKAGAFKFALRMTYAALVYVGVSRLPSRARSHIAVCGAATAALVVMTGVGLLENFTRFVYWPEVLSPWQEALTTFGAFYNVRGTSTMPYPTVFSAYLELALALAMAFGLWLLIRRRLSVWGRRALGAAMFVVIAAVMMVQVYTYTRTALLSTPFAMLLAALLAWRYGYGRQVAAWFVAAAVLLVAALGSTTFTSNTMATRLGIAEQKTRYAAEYQVLDFPASIRTGQLSTARIRLRNTSDVNWSPSGMEQVQFTERWIDYATREEVTVPYILTDLPRSVGPGEFIDLDISFNAPADSGRYVLVMELAKVGVGWFSAADVLPLVQPLEIGPAGSQPFTMPETPADFKYKTPPSKTPGRSQLWRAAWNAFKAKPILGLGPDQFRHRYPEYLPGVEPDENVRTHNIVLEAAVNTGLIGLAAMLFLLLSAAWTVFRLVRERSLGRGARLVSLGLAAALAAYASHGMTDYLLWQTGMAFLFFTILGLAAWLEDQRAHGESGRPADAAAPGHMRQGMKYISL